MKKLSKDSRYNVNPWLICLSASLFFLFVFIQMNVFNAINQELLESFNLSSLQLGQLSSYYLLGIVIFFFPAGYILDRYSIKKTLLFGIIIAGFGTAIFAITNNLFLAKLGRLMTGMMHAIAFLGCFRLASYWLKNSIGFAMGIIVTIGFMGGMIAQTPMVTLVNLMGWRNAELILASFSIIIFLVMLKYIKDPLVPLSIVKTNFIGDFKEIFLLKQNWYCSFYTAFLNLPAILLGALWGNMLLVKHHHLTQTQASSVVAMIYLGIIVGSPLIGMLSDKRKKRKSFMKIGAFLSLITSLLIVCVPDMPFISLFTLFLLLGIFSSTETLSYPTITESNPQAITGTALGFASILVIGLGAIFQPLLGFALDLKQNVTFLSFDYGHGFAFNIIPFAAFFSFVIAFAVRETNCKSINEKGDIL